MSNEVFSKIKEVLRYSENGRSSVSEKVDEIIEGLNRERERYLRKVILEIERMWADRLIDAVQEASVINKAIDNLSDSPETLELNKRFVRSIRCNQAIREMLLPNRPNMAEEIQQDDSFLMNREQLLYGARTGREIDLYIPGQYPGGNLMKFFENAFKKELDLRIRIEERGMLDVHSQPRINKSYHLLLENVLKPVNGTNIFSVRREISAKTNQIPKDLDLTYQGLTRLEFLYYCLYTHLDNSYNGIEIGILPTLIQDVQFKDYQGRTSAFLGAELTQNSLNFIKLEPDHMHERHLLLAKKQEFLP